MCTHSRWIYNHYTHKKVLVPCGHCEACLQEKACRRSNRIRNNVTSGTLTLFITLTYTNDFVPYVQRDKLTSLDDLLVLRRSTGRFVFDRHSNKLRFVKSPGVSIVSAVAQENAERYNNLPKYSHLVGLPKDCIGVCYYPDLQNFFKRLRIILKRHFNYEKYFSFFACSELGAATKRPHFHALLFIRPSDEEIFRKAILEAWPFADRHRTAEYIEVARDAASYVSSYVNSHSRLLSLFENDAFKPKHSYSKNFGAVLECFQLPQIIEKIERRDLRYYSGKEYDGQSCVSSMPIPQYIINRHFPKFKGLCRIPVFQLYHLLSCPEEFGYFFRDSEVTFSHFVPGVEDSIYNSVYRVRFNTSPCVDSPVYHFSNSETYRIYVAIENAYKRFHDITGLNRFDFARYYIDAWNLYFSTILEDSFKDIEVMSDYSEHYDNAVILENTTCHLKRRWLFHKLSPTLQGVKLNPNYNDRTFVRSRTSKFVDLYYKLDKEKKVINYSMSRMGHNV